MGFCGMHPTGRLQANLGRIPMKFMDRCVRAGILTAAMAGAMLISTMASPAEAQTVKWRTIIGVIQAGNVVLGIGGGGQPWSTLGGDASVNLSTGRVEFEVRGLVLAGGDTIGSPGAVNQVKGTIACPAATPVVIDTPLVTL